MKNIFINVQKSSKGITLIAMVVTIIVLLILAGISITMTIGENGLITKAGEGSKSIKYATYKEEVDLYFQGEFTKSKGNSDAYNVSITDKTKLKEIMPKATDTDLDKLLIQNGKLVYDPEKVDNSEKELMERIGILSMTLRATIVFIVNGQEYARIQSDKIEFPELIPESTSDGYTFIGWYYDQEAIYPFINRADILNNISGGYMDASVHEQNKAYEGDDIDENEITLYATFRGNSALNTCLAKGTKVTLADKSKKNIEDITYEDRLLVWNFDEGKIDNAEPVWIMKKEQANKYLQFKFENGMELKLTIHRIFNVDKQIFANADMDEEMPIGTTVFLEDGTTTKLIEKNEIEEVIDVYNVMTKEHINLFAEGILTSLRFNELYDIKNMKFIKDNRELNEREKYENIPDNYFYGLRLAEQKNTLTEDGNIWWEDRVINVLMKNERYSNAS